MANPNLYDINTLRQAGISPASVGIKKGIVDAYNKNADYLKLNIKKFMSIQDEQDALNRFTWTNLPKELDGNLIERLLYYKGQGMFFYIKTMEKYFFLPYALSGTIDVYGRFLKVTPVPFAGGKVDNDGKVMPWINGLTREVIYNEGEEETDQEESKDIKCVLLSDYSKQLSQIITPRSALQDPIIDIMSEVIPFMRTNLISATGVSAMRVNNEDEQSNVKAASDSILMAGLTGKKWIPIVGSIEFQELNNKSAIGSSEDFFMAFQSLDNLRMSGYGLGGGVFNKLGSTLQDEADRNNINTQLILQDALEQRKKFCELVNSVFGLNISCEVSEIVQGVDEDPEEALDEEEIGSEEEESDDSSI